MMKWGKWLIKASLELKKNKILNPRKDAEILLEHVTNFSRTKLLTYEDTQLTNIQIKKLNSLLKKRILGKPISYLIGTCDFWSLRLKICHGVFIPRPDTECIIRVILKLLSKKRTNILDLGTGSGAIALALASERKNWKITGTELIYKTLILARKNCNMLGYKNVKFIHGNWFNAVKNKRYNLIVSNPPYIGKREILYLKNNVLFESKVSLIAKKNGLSQLIKICNLAKEHLFKKGWLVVEHGWNQGNSVRKLLIYSGFRNISTENDYNGYERVSKGQFLSIK